MNTRQEISIPQLPWTSGRMQILDAMALLYPELLVGAFYVTWLLAWFTLGHPPRASLDDPKETVGAIYDISGIVVMLMPFGAALAFASLAVRVVYPEYSNRSRIAFAVIIVTLWVAALVLLRSDPIGVVYWWLD